MAAGKLLYCLDRGYGYRWGRKFLEQLHLYLCHRRGRGYRPETALAQSGMGELDAQQRKLQVDDDVHFGL